eukprot:Phypoly_transcript_03220.p1 GENE.Phypoly_transcript_03220~~Phypoly_transcript_03220.p1  ORF type:complete len:700 (+),score=127.66 Phypoly_transcript_03220:236-2335(+)
MIVKVVVTGPNAPPKEYELNRDQPYRGHVSALCTLFNINGNVNDYVLQFQGGAYISEEDYSTPEFGIPNNATLVLKLKPEPAAEAVLKSLKESDSNDKKKALFAKLRDTLKDEEFARKFLAKNGVEAITSQVDELSGNTLAYALSALQTAMSYDFSWEFPNAFVEKILSLTDSTNPNVVKSSLRILCRMCESTKYGFAAVSTACKTTAKQANKQPYASLIALLGSTDIDIQLSTLTLINTLTSHAPAGAERNTFLQLLDLQDINSILKRQLVTTDTEFKKQLHTFQKHKLHVYKNIKLPYDKTNSDHEATLMRLWTATYPDTKLESRVSEQWKSLGFQGTDPATDFRGMGLLGLEQLVYFAEKHNDIFRKIVNGQIARKEREYPVAVAGINITQKLYDILKINDEAGQDTTIFPIIFSHNHAFEEMYCTTFQVLDHTWDDMNASYMDFPKVLAAVQKQIMEVIDARPLTLEQFHMAACFKGSNLSMGEPDIEEPESVKKLRTTVKKEVLEMVKQQKLSYLTDGCCFRVLKGATSKNKGAQSFFFARVNENHTELAWGPVADVHERPGNLPNTVKVSEITSVALGHDIPSFSKKKPSEDIVALAFAFLCKDEKQTVEFLAINREDFVNWVDGMRALLGKSMDCAETLEEAKTLVSLEMKMRLLDLEGFEIPKDPPAIPEIPTDFDFVETREKRTRGPNSH